MRPAWVAVLSGCLGFVAGALSYGWLAARQLDALHGTVQVRFALEQEYRASRAERQGDLLAAWHHQRNVVEAQSDAWLHSAPAWGRLGPWFALDLAMLRRIQQATSREGRQRVEADVRGHLAWLLEAAGQPEQAAAEWERAAHLARSGSVSQLRERIAYLRAQRAASTVHRQAEAVILGPEHGAQ
jgi:hypothetical protein